MKCHDVMRFNEVRETGNMCVRTGVCWAVNTKKRERPKVLGACACVRYSYM